VEEQVLSRLAALPRRVVRRARRALREVRSAVTRTLRPRPTLPVERPIPPEDIPLRKRLEWQGARLDPEPPAEIWRDWENAVLRTRGQGAAARQALTDAGLHPHPDEPKNWDALLALGLILDRFPPTARVLDAGATLYSRLLPWLYLYGYRRLHGVDLTFEEPVEMGPIRYEGMDLTATSFEPRSFDAIACLSVIEHGVPIEAYLREAARLLRPGGLLITSTDFWCEPLLTGGKEAYGVAAHVFTPAEIEACIAEGRRHGLRLTRRLDLRCEDKVVHWDRIDLDFTFAAFVLERAGPWPWSIRVRAVRRAVRRRWRRLRGWRQSERARRSTSAT
jgi:SAM-dependent methyltransferase